MSIEGSLLPEPSSSSITLTEDERKKIAELLPKLDEVKAKLVCLERRLNKNTPDDWSAVVASYAALAKLVAANFKGTDTGEYGKSAGLSLRPRAAQWDDAVVGRCSSGALLGTKPLPDEDEERECYEHLPEHERLAFEPSKRRRLHKEIAETAEECKGELDGIIVDCLYPDSDEGDEGDEEDEGERDGESEGDDDDDDDETRELRTLLGLYLLGDGSRSDKQ